MCVLCQPKRRNSLKTGQTHSRKLQGGGGGETYKSNGSISGGGIYLLGPPSRFKLCVSSCDQPSARTHTEWMNVYVLPIQDWCMIDGRLVHTDSDVASVQLGYVSSREAMLYR